MALQLKFESEGNPDIVWYFGEASANFQDGTDNYPEQGVEASYSTAFANANAEKGATLWACRSGNLVSVWGGYGDTEADRVHNAQIGIARIADCVSNSFTMDGAHFTYIEDLGQLQNETYVYTKNGKKIKWTGSLMQVYDADDNLLGSSSYVTAGTYPYFVNIPATIPKEWTITDWRNAVNVGYLNPTFIRIGGGVVPYSNFLSSAKVSKVTGASDIQNHADWLFYLLHDPNADFSPDEKPEPGPEPGDDPYINPYDPAGPGGGDGDGDDPYDPGDDIEYPDDPPFSIADTGLMSVYIPSNVQLNLLAGYLWSNNFVTSLVKDVYADPMDVILSLGVLPFNIPVAGTANIKVGDRDSGVSSNVPQNKYINLDCGSVQLKTTVGAYIDFAPYTKGDIYIPFVGFVPLDIDAFMGHSVGLKYKVDICTGSAIAFLLKDNKVWQTFACNLLTPIPLTSANYAQVWNTIVGATASLAGAGVMSIAGIGAASGAGQAANAANSALANSTTAYNTASALSSSTEIMTSAATKPTIQKSNNIAVTSGILCNKKPFIQLHRPNLMIPANQKGYQGYPSYIECQLSSLNGYTRISSINLAVASATGRELKMIDAILKTGFIIGSGENLSGSGIILGKNSSPTHQINKNVSSVATLTGSFRDSVDIISPVVRIEHASPIDFNYIYISDFNRYYFVDDITIVRTGVMDVKLSCDVLESHKSGILANNAIIDKQANNYNLYLNDDSIKMRQDPIVTCFEFPSGFFDNGAFEFVLCVAGN